MLPASWAITHLGNIHQNLVNIRARVGDRLILAPVKANAYGHGAIAVSRMIQQTEAADWLAVATGAEAVELRTAGITMPILKLTLTPLADLAETLVADVSLCVADEVTIRQAATAAQSLGCIAKVHLKIDTGMHRLGTDPVDAVALARLIDALNGVELEGVFSHLAESDTTQGVAFTNEQTALFSQTVAAIEAARGPIPLVHLANSGAILGHPSTWFDLVRPGVMIYGAYPDPEAPRSVTLQPGLSWRSRVGFVKRVRAGETVSYGRTWRAAQDTWIGAVMVGYGDGYSRLLSNRGRVLINGRSYPIAGRVAMDQTMVDLGPETDVRVDDEVVLVGRSGDEEITTAEIAALMDTIPYEVTCLITARVGREYRP